MLALQRQLLAIRTIPAAKELRDKAAALAVYYRQQRAAGALERQAAEIRIRAERKIGELLSRSHRATLPAGITKTQSSRWQMLARLPETVFERELARKPSTTALVKLAQSRKPKRGPEQGGDIYTCDVLDLDCQPNLILTDPPYADLDAYRRLAEFAGRHDCPCLCYCGQAYLPQVLDAMRSLKYQWTFAVQYGGRHNAIHGRRVQCCWKPVLWFGRGPREYVVDMLSGQRTKNLHVWQQPECEANYLIERFTSSGELVCDPFCGSGTVLAAAKVLGRRWIGCDVDAGSARIARRRVA